MRSIKIRQVLTVAVLCAICKANAYEYKNGSTTYSFTVKDGAACITSVNLGVNQSGNISIPSIVKREYGLNNSVTYPVRYVGDGSSSVWSRSIYVFTRGAMRIPEGVVEINANALKTGSTSDRWEITAIYLPTTLKKVGKDAFASTYFSSVSQPIVRIDDLAAWCDIDFANAKGNPLANARGLELVDKTYMVNGSYLYRTINQLVIPDGIERVKAYAFYNCRPIESVAIQSPCQNIGEFAFCNCTNLSSLALHDNITVIGESAFEGCKKLSYVSLPSGLSVIGARAYKNTGLIDVAIPNGVTDIGEEAFCQCASLKSLVIPTSVQRIGANVVSRYSQLSNIVGPHRHQSYFYSCNPEATYTYNDAIISFDANGGEVAASTITADLGTTIRELPTPVRDGHSFAGWFTAQEGGALVGNGIMASGDATYYAHWNIVTHTVTFNACGGECGEVSRVCTELEGIGTLPEPSREDYIFDGWFTEMEGGILVDSSTVFTDDVTLYAHWTEEAVTEVATPQITPTDGSEFITDMCLVAITCDTRNATIYYSTNGTPRQTAAYEYTEPFYISNTSTIKAIAVKRGCKSEYAVAKITKKALSLQEAVDMPTLSAATGGNAVWVVVGDQSAVGGICARSGAIGLSQKSWLQVDVSGKGLLSFDWRVSCEGDDSGDCSWDRLVCQVDGIECFRIDGVMDSFEHKEIQISTSGRHTVRWTYIKDDFDDDPVVYADCAWVDNVAWTVFDPIPEISSDDEVSEALLGTADASLTANVTNTAQYAAYRDWALSVTNATTTVQMIKESARTWLSYALGAEALLSKELTSDDVKIEAFSPTTTDGKFDFTVSVKDVNIGGGAVEEEALKENLKKVLGIEGAASLVPDAGKTFDELFSSDNIDITIGAPVDGKARFTVSPPANAGNSFFLRVKVK